MVYILLSPLLWGRLSRWAYQPLTISREQCLGEQVYTSTVNMIRKSMGVSCEGLWQVVFPSITEKKFESSKEWEGAWGGTRQRKLWTCNKDSKNMVLFPTVLPVGLNSCVKHADTEQERLSQRLHTLYTARTEVYSFIFCTVGTRLTKPDLSSRHGARKMKP